MKAMFRGCLIALLAAAGGTANAAEPTPIRVGQSSPANTFLAIWMADASGIYEANGLKLEIVPMVGGRGIETAFATGRIDAMHIGLSSVVRANAGGANLRAFGSLSNHIRFALIAAPGIKSAADLKGRAVGISSFGSESDTTLAMMLAKLGLSRSDVDVREAGVKRLEGLRSGAIAATPVNEPERTVATATGLTALVDFGNDNIPWLFTGLVTRQDALTGKRDLIVRFMKATIEGNRLALTDETRAKAVLQKQIGVADAKVVDIIYADFKAQTPPFAEVLPEAARATIDAVASAQSSRKLDDYIDTGITAELKAQGYFDTITRKYPQR